MVAFTAGAVLTAANLNSAFNALTIRTVTGTSDTLVLADNGGAVTYSNASPVSVTVPLFSSIAYATGTKIVLVNLGAGTVTIAGTGGVTVNGSPLTLAQNAGGTLLKTDTNTWSFLPFSSGVGAANFSDTATGSYTGYKYLTFTSSGTITISTAGLADLVIVGGGGRGGTGIGNPGAGGGGGAGGFANLSQVYLPAGTLTVTVGGATGPSRIGSYVSPQGGQGGDGAGNRAGDWGGCGGGGGGGATAAGGTALVSFGFDGGSTSGSSGGASGGGGAGAVGSANSTTTGGAGGAGSSTTIAGTTPTGAYVAGSFSFGGGGGGGGYNSGSGGAAGATGGAAGSGSGNGANAAANLGGGGGGAYGSTTIGTIYSGGLGGSGFIIVRVAV